MSEFNVVEDLQWQLGGPVCQEFDLEHFNQTVIKLNQEVSEMKKQNTCFDDAEDGFHVLQSNLFDDVKIISEKKGPYWYETRAFDSLDLNQWSYVSKVYL